MALYLVLGQKESRRQRMKRSKCFFKVEKSRAIVCVYHDYGSLSVFLTLYDCYYKNLRKIIYVNVNVLYVYVNEYKNRFD